MHSVKHRKLEWQSGPQVHSVKTGIRNDSQRSFVHSVNAGNGNDSLAPRVNGANTVTGNDSQDPGTVHSVKTAPGNPWSLGT